MYTFISKWKLAEQIELARKMADKEEQSKCGASHKLGQTYQIDYRDDSARLNTICFFVVIFQML